MRTSATVPMVVTILLYQGPTGWILPRRLSESLDVPPELLAVFPSPVESAASRMRPLSRDTLFGGAKARRCST